MSFLFLVRFDVVDGVAHGFDALSVFVRDFDVEFFFELHDEFKGVEAVSAEVSGERCFGGYLFGSETEFVYDDRSYAICSF